MTSFEIISTQQIFEFGGSREAVITTEKAEILLRAIVEQDPIHIRLSNKSFSSEAAIVISNRLTTFRKIEIADISDIIAGRPEEDALLTLKTICESMLGNSLIELNVSDNALGSKGVTACHTAITCKTLQVSETLSLSLSLSPLSLSLSLSSLSPLSLLLQRLYFCNNGMSADACVLIKEILLEGGCPKLTALHFYNNMSGDGGAVAIGGMMELGLGVRVKS
jgi:hypothetical protein